MMKVANKLTDLIGKTPMLKLNNYNETKGVDGIIAKLEYFNPLGSVKDRAAFEMIDAAEKDGKLTPGTVIIEPTSGNTGVGLAFVAASKGYDLILTMPDTMSVERRNLLSALGAKLILTPGAGGMKAAIDKAYELQEEYEKSFIPQQFENNANPDAHRKTTALEILEDLDEKVDIFVAGVGTGGTITGVGETLKEKLKDVKIVAVEPEGSAVISGESPGPHKIQGIGAGFIPKNLNTEVIDEVIKVKNEDAFETSKQVARSEGLLVGISSGAALHAATVLASRPENKGKNIVVLLADSGERYLSTALYS
ncbi:cysteine synthase A [Acidaminobacter sp. JC074]|nr:cysteine synthase A [Acidaminobacter sp. JC074]MCH4886812.1 cysteine synthase A [Acidaminobacter sp. JC074]